MNDEITLHRPEGNEKHGDSQSKTLNVSASVDALGLF
jgi:hypothetical protein